MIVGILSMQRVINYGSFLQAYALKCELEKMGNDVKFVDIESDTELDFKSKVIGIFKKFQLIDRYLLRRIIDSKKNRALNDVLLCAQEKYLGLDKSRMRSDSCEAVVIGSDEIFNCDSNSVWGINGQRFGDIDNVNFCVSYAASCGYTGIENIRAEDKKTIEKGLKKLSHISVRDRNTFNFVKEMSGRTANYNLDPVLVYDFCKELELGEKEGLPTEPYMVVYAYHNRIDDKVEINSIRNYAKNNGLKTIAIGGSLPWCDDFAVLTPFQVLAYFKNAKCIVTDTFHGTVISAKFNKPVAVIVRDSNYNKLHDLVERLHIQQHVYRKGDNLEAILQTADSYDSCNMEIERGIKDARQYLSECGF